MSAEDKALTQKIFREYSEYLDKAGVPYKNDQNGFYVYIPLQNIEERVLHRYANPVMEKFTCGIITGTVIQG